MTVEEFEVTAADEPHPEIAALLAERESSQIPSFQSLSPEGARRFQARTAVEPDEPEPVDDIMELAIGKEGIRVRVYVPEVEGPYSTLVYFHSGGWVIGDIDTADATCRELTNETDAMVVSVDYRLAPEHKFPTALEDCYTVLKWVFNDADSMQVDTDRVAVVGDSSGGNLAATVALLARERDGPDIAHQTLIYPVTNYTFDTNSYEENAEGYLLTKAAMEWFWKLYLRDAIDGKNPYASPLQAESLEGLPPATIVTCGFDPLRDEGAAYAQKLQKDGVSVNFSNYEDCIHGIAQFLVEPADLTRSHELITEVAADLRSSFE